MTWKSIVAGVDTSPEGAWAAATAWRLATAAGVPCHLIHVVADVAIPPGSTPGVADVAAFRAAVLRAKYRRCITLRLIEERSYDDIAETLGLPVGTVTTYIHRAQKQLKQMLAPLAPLLALRSRRYARLRDHLAGRF